MCDVVFDAVVCQVSVLERLHQYVSVAVCVAAHAAVCDVVLVSGLPGIRARASTSVLVCRSVCCSVCCIVSCSV